jgi:hypothetical protein
MVLDLKSLMVSIIMGGEEQEHPGAKRPPSQKIRPYTLRTRSAGDFGPGGSYIVPPSTRLTVAWRFNEHVSLHTHHALCYKSPLLNFLQNPKFLIFPYSNLTATKVAYLLLAGRIRSPRIVNLEYLKNLSHSLNQASIYLGQKDMVAMNGFVAMNMTFVIVWR